MNEPFSSFRRVAISEANANSPTPDFGLPIQATGYAYLLIGAGGQA